MDLNLIPKYIAIEKSKGPIWFKLVGSIPPNGLGPQYYAHEYAKTLGHNFFIAKDYCSSKTKTSKAYTSFLDVNEYLQFLESIPQKDRVFYEQVLDNGPTVEFYDLDNSKNPLEPRRLYEMFVEARHYFGISKGLEMNFDMIKCLNSSDSNKTSLHILYRGMSFETIQDHKIWTEEFWRFLDMEFKPIKESLDMKIYTKNRCFRTIHSSKLGSTRILLPFDDVNTSIEEYFITNIPSGIKLTSFPKPAIIKPVKIEKYTDPKNKYHKISGALDAIIESVTNENHSLCDIKVPNKINYESLSKLKLILNNELGEEGFGLYEEKCISLYKHGEERMNELLSYYTASENIDKKKLTFGTLKFWANENSNYNITLETKLKNILKTFKQKRLKIENHDVLTNIKTLKMKNLTNEKIQVIIADTGFGKTEKLIEHLQKNINKKVLSITPRVSLADSQHSTFPDFKHYNNVFKSPVNNEDLHKLIIEFESLFKLSEVMADENYEYPQILVLDEFSELISKINSPTCHSHGQIVFTIFIDLIRHCKQVVILDADFNKISYAVLKRICPKTKINITCYTTPKNNYTAYLTDNKEVWNRKVFNSLDNDKRIAIATTSPSKLKALTRLINEKYPNKIVKNVLAETSKALKSEIFSDLEAYLEDCDVFIYTPTCSHGVSYKKVHFDECFGYFSPKADVHYKTCLQLLRRIRNIGSLTFYIYLNPPEYKLPYKFEAVEKEFESRRTPTLFGVSREYSIKKGCFVYPNKNIIYHMYIQNLMSVNYSKNFFLEGFVHTALKRGFEFKMMNSDPNKNEIEKELKVKSEEINREYYEKLASLKLIDVNKRNKLINKPDKDTEEEMLLRKRLLADEYHLDELSPGLDDPEFLKKYDNAAVKQAKRNRFNIDERFVSLQLPGQVYDNIKIIEDNERQEHEFLMKNNQVFTDLNKKYTSKKHYYCHLLCNFLGFDHAFDYKKVLNRNEILDNWNKNWNKKIKEDIDYWFNKTNKGKINDSILKNILRYINGCLTFYGVSVKQVRHNNKGKGNKFKIHENKDFNNPGQPIIGKNCIFNYNK